MSDEKNEKKKEEILDQEIELDELDSVAGGGFGKKVDFAGGSNTADDINNCTRNHERNIYLGGFPNCAATVEDGSWCDTNDACLSSAVKYQGMNDCSKAWR